MIICQRLRGGVPLASLMCKGLKASQELQRESTGLGAMHNIYKVQMKLHGCVATGRMPGSCSQEHKSNNLQVNSIAGKPPAVTSSWIMNQCAFWKARSNAVCSAMSLCARHASVDPAEPAAATIKACAKAG